MNNIIVQVSVAVIEKTSWTDERTIAKSVIEHGGTLSYEEIQSQVRILTEAARARTYRQVRRDENLTDTAAEPEPVAAE